MNYKEIQNNSGIYEKHILIYNKNVKHVVLMKLYIYSLLSGPKELE